MWRACVRACAQDTHEHSTAPKDFGPASKRRSRGHGSSILAALLRQASSGSSSTAAVRAAAAAAPWRASAFFLRAATSPASTPIATKRNVAAKTSLSKEGLQTLGPNTSSHQQQCECDHKMRAVFVLVAICLRHRALTLSIGC